MIYIREITADDAGALFALVEANREFLMPWIEWVPLVTDMESSKFFIRCSGNIYGAWDGMQLVGLSTVARSAGGRWSFGALVGESSCGSGTALRLFDFCMGAMSQMVEPNVVFCKVSERNVRSTRYVQKCGFVPTGHRDGEMVEHARKVG